MFKFTKKYTLFSLLSREIENDWKILDLGRGRNSLLQYLDLQNYKVGLDMFTHLVYP